jgi:hypothetical protein
LKSTLKKRERHESRKGIIWEEEGGEGEIRE